MQGSGELGDSRVAAVAQAIPEALDFEALSEHLAERLIYVVGNARGGSTFTNSAIGIHPKILCVGWNDIIFGHIQPKLGSLDEAELRKRMLRPDSGKHYDEAVAARNIGEANLRRWHTYVDEVCRSRDLGRLFCLQGLLYWIMHQPLADIRDCSAWCIKENSWAGIDRLKRIMPKTRIVFVQRDPRSNALSFAKVYARVRREQFNNRDVTQGALNWLRNAVEFGVRLNRYDDALLLYFEQLISDAPATLNRIWTELGLDRLEASATQGALTKVEYTTTKTHEERGRGPNASGLHTAPLTRWREQLSRKQVANICALTKAGADYFGYTLDSEPKVRDIASALRESGAARLAKASAVYFYCRARLLLIPKAKQVTS